MAVLDSVSLASDMCGSDGGEDRLRARLLLRGVADGRAAAVLKTCMLVL